MHLLTQDLSILQMSGGVGELKRMKFQLCLLAVAAALASERACLGLMM